MGSRNRFKTKEQIKAEREARQKAVDVVQKNKKTKKLTQTIAAAEKTVTQKGRQGHSQKKIKQRALKQLSEQFKTKGARKSIQDKLKKGGFSQSELDIKRAKASLSKSNKSEISSFILSESLKICSKKLLVIPSSRSRDVSADSAANLTDAIGVFNS